MIRNPFSRRRRSPVDQALDVLDGVRAEAHEVASTVRDAAAKAAEALGDATPPVTKARWPLIGAAAAAGIAVAVFLRSRGRSGAEPPVGAQPASTAKQTAAKAKSPPPVPAAGKSGSEEPSEPKAKTPEATAETPAAAGSKPAASVEPEEPKEPKAKTEESAG